ncbi:alpha/beta hydrolase family protein [Pleionea sediminis]|uniref:alpha/beta hydrolase family protein n=1 Tax=Pleionea sediminis TaxID=2569479 RepID=UPI001186C9A5|nr:prolyl oligopeptidase family serine peptidase [Pleionea sediminis]
MKQFILILIVSLFFALPSYSGQYIASKDIFSSANYHSFKINPKGNLIVGQMNLDGFNSLIVFRVSDLNAMEVFAIPELGNTINGFDWIDDDSLYVSFRLKGDLRPLRILNLKDVTGEIDLDLFDLQLTGYIVDALPKHSDRILFAKSHYDGEGYSLYNLDLTQFEDKSRSKQVAYARSIVNEGLSRQFGDAYRFVVDENKELSFVHELSDDESTFHYFDKERNEWLEIYSISKESESSKSNNDEYESLVYRPLAGIDSDRIAVLTNVDRDKTAVVVFNINTKQFEDVLYESDYYDIKGASWNFEENMLDSVYFTERGIRQRKYFASKNKASHQYLKSKIKRNSIFIIDSSTDKRHKIVFARDATHPGEYFYFNSQTKEMKMLQSSMPALYEHQFIDGQYISEKNTNNDLVEGFLYLPESKSKKPPLIVMPHGGPVGVQDVNDFNRGVQFLVNRGYAVLKVNFRGSAGYGKAFKNAGRGEWGKGIEEDIELILNKVLNRALVDPDKLCIYGQSYGGYSALVSAIHNPNQYQCAIAGFPVTDLPLVFSATNIKQIKSVQKAIEKVVGKIEDNYESLIKRSPVYNADRLNVPVLLLGGIRDDIATFEHTRRMKYMLDHFNKDVRMYAYNTSHGHEFWFGDRHHYIVLTEFLDDKLGIKRTLNDNEKKLYAEDYFFLGGMHRQGLYVEKSKEKAQYFFKKAARLGSLEARKELRKMGIYDFNE